jgi:hypothetical protein
MDGVTVHGTGAVKVERMIAPEKTAWRVARTGCILYAPGALRSTCAPRFLGVHPDVWKRLWLIQDAWKNVTKLQFFEIAVLARSSGVQRAERALYAQ